jgi:hypothetical protein
VLFNNQIIVLFIIAFCFKSFGSDTQSERLKKYQGEIEKYLEEERKKSKAESLAREARWEKDRAEREKYFAKERKNSEAESLAREARWEKDQAGREKYFAKERKKLQAARHVNQ